MVAVSPDPPGRLPTPPTPLVGREREVEAVGSLLSDSAVRLVTLTGPGGVGKTRLALAAAERLASEFGAAAFVDLAPARDPALVPAAVAAALGIRDAGDAPLADRLAAHLRDRPLLLVLDNLEQVLDAAPFVVGLLAASPTQRILATSREPLRLSAERVFPVEPLPVPGPDQASADDVAGVPAVELFVRRATAADPAFALTQENADSVAGIVRRLDGLPLALELAAARVRALPPAALLPRLDAPLRVLTGGPRDAPARQRTVRDAITWSHDLLPPGERVLLRRLGVFVGGFALEAAEAVAAGVADECADAVDGVASLVDKGLLRRIDGPGGGGRYRMLEPVREFALERLAASGEEAAVRDAHLAWAAAFVRRTCPPIHGPVVSEPLDRLEPDHDNLRAALAWAVERGDGATALWMSGALRDFWYLRGHQAEGRRWLDAALGTAAGEAPTADRAQALLALGELANDLGDPARGEAALRESLDLYRSLGDRQGAAFALDLLGVEAEDRGAYAVAERLMTAARADFEALGDRHTACQALYHLGVIALGQGDADLAMTRWDEAQRQARADDDLFNIANTLWYQALVHSLRGQLPLAAEALEEALATERALGSYEGAVPFLPVAAVLAVAAGSPETAARLLGTAHAAAERRSLRFDLPEREHYDRARTAAKDRLGEAAFRTAWEAGRVRTLEGALPDVAAVLAAGRMQPGPAEAPNPAAARGLTKRELEVLRLVAAGKSDREIAAELFVAYRTVTSCVTSILRKLDATSRTAAAAYAIRHGLA